MSIKDSIRKVNAAFPALSVLENEKRNQALRLAGETLMERKEEIFAANEKDLAAAREAGLDAPILKRLEFNEQKLKEVVSGLHDLSTLLRDALACSQIMFPYTAIHIVDDLHTWVTAGQLIQCGAVVGRRLQNTDLHSNPPLSIPAFSLAFFGR